MTWLPETVTGATPIERAQSSRAARTARLFLARIEFLATL
jgi:hypothetical protein